MPAPKGPILCKYESLAETLALLAGEVPGDLPRCDELAAYSVLVSRTRPGQVLDIWTQMCVEHQRQSADIPGVGRSPAIRQPEPDPEVTLSPETLAMVKEVEKALPSMQTPEFAVISERLLSKQVCTSLPDDEATARVNAIPSGTSHGWQLSTEPVNAPVACADQPETHRHLIFDC